MDFDITAKTIWSSFEELYKLKHNGQKIKELYECQKKARSREHKSTEYTYKPIKEKENVSKESLNKKGNPHKNKKNNHVKYKGMYII